MNKEPDPVLAWTRKLLEAQSPMTSSWVKREEDPETFVKSYEAFRRQLPDLEKSGPIDERLLYMAKRRFAALQSSYQVAKLQVAKLVPQNPADEPAEKFD